MLRLEPLYRIRFTYPASRMVGPDGGWEQHMFIAEGRCEGSINGRFRGGELSAPGGCNPGRSGPTSAPSSRPTTRRRSCSNGTDTAAPIRPDDDRSWAPSSTSATQSHIAASTTSSACVSERCGRPAIRIRPNPTSWWTLPSWSGNRSPTGTASTSAEFAHDRDHVEVGVVEVLQHDARHARGLVGAEPLGGLL